MHYKSYTPAEALEAWAKAELNLSNCIAFGPLGVFTPEALLEDKALKRGTSQWLSYTRLVQIEKPNPSIVGELLRAYPKCPSCKRELFTPVFATVDEKSVFITATCDHCDTQAKVEVGFI